MFEETKQIQVKEEIKDKVQARLFIIKEVEEHLSSKKSSQSKGRLIKKSRHVNDKDDQVRHCVQGTKNVKPKNDAEP